MISRRALTLACGIGAAATLAGPAAAQSFVPQPQAYLLSTDVSDGRTLWVQPANLARKREASVSALLTVNRTGGSSSVGQYGATLASGMLALGWQHDRYGAGSRSDVFALGLSGGGPVVSIGADRRWYRGTGTSDGSWDIGARYLATQALEMSVVWRDLSSPVVAGDTINATLVPGAALQLLRGRARVGADWEILTSRWSTSAIRIGASLALPSHLSLNLRGEVTGRLHGRGFSVALTWGGAAARVTAFSAAANAPDVDRFGAWGAAVSNPFQPRRFGR